MIPVVAGSSPVSRPTSSFFVVDKEFIIYGIIDLNDIIYFTGILKILGVTHV